jgi:RNA 2',3'-cyclic 3'-phosphodiesterase
MTTDDPIKRLFFAFEVDAPWPEALPSGRILEPSCRHMTLAFLGNIPFAPLFR